MVTLSGAGHWDADDLSVTFGEKSSGVTSVGVLDGLRLLLRGRVSPIENFRGFPANVPGGGFGLVEPEDFVDPAEPVDFVLSRFLKLDKFALSTRSLNPCPGKPVPCEVQYVFITSSNWVSTDASAGKVRSRIISTFASTLLINPPSLQLDEPIMTIASWAFEKI